MSSRDENSTTNDAKQEAHPQQTKTKRKGAKAQKRSSEKFRTRRGEQEAANFARSIEEKYSLFESDNGPLKQAVNNVTIVSQPCATPISVTTRGVGMAVAICYSRSCTTWNTAAVSEIATIHQVYRVALMCCHLKVYLAQQEQVEGVSVSGAHRRIVLDDEVREVIAQISQVPSTLALVLDCIGKIEHDGGIWHMGYPNPTWCTGIEWRYLTLSPDTIRETLLWLSSDQTPPEERQEFISQNPIPGAHFENGLLVNADAVWPADYGANSVRADVHAYKSWISRVETRLPEHMFPRVTWSGRGSAGGLVSVEDYDLKITNSMTRLQQPAVQTGKGRRDASGVRRAVTNEAATSRLVSLNVSGGRAEFWEPQRITTINQVMGSSSLVGEVCCIETRHKTNAREHFTTDPVTTVMNLCDAPRR